MTGAALAHVPAVRHENFAARFDDAVSERSLERANRVGDNFEFKVGQIAYAVKEASRLLWERGEGGADYDGPRRDELPVVSLETIGRLTVFVRDIDRNVEVLMRDADTIRDTLAFLYDASEVATDVARFESKAAA